MDALQQYSRKIEAARRAYAARKSVIQASRDHTPAAKNKALRVAKNEYLAEVATVRQALAPKVREAAGQMADKRRGVVGEQLGALYEHLDRLGAAGAARVMLITRLVEMGTPGELWALYKTGDPIAQGIIALLPSAYADGKDTAANALRALVEADISAGLADGEKALGDAEKFLVSLDIDPDAVIERRVQQYGGDVVGDPRQLERLLSREVSEADKRQALADLPRLLAVEE